jgi:hypothetical protein
MLWLTCYAIEQPNKQSAAEFFHLSHILFGCRNKHCATIPLLYRPLRLIFLARGNASKPVKNAMLANTHDANPEYWSAMIMEFRVLRCYRSLKKKIQRLIF